MEKGTFENYPPADNNRASRLPQTIPSVLKEILDMIVRLMMPEKVFLAGVYKNDPPDERLLYDLLIIIPGGANRPYSEYDIIIKNISASIYPVTAVILKRNDLHRKLAEGHIYFSRVCCPEKLVYDDGTRPLPAAAHVPVEEIIAKSEKQFQHGQNRARSFLEGAQYYFRHRENELAAFMLHQAVEQLYRGFLKGLTEQEVVSHDLRSLMRRCRRCAPEFIYVFHEHDEEERHLFSLLQRAYIHTRYKNNYAIDTGDLKALMDKIGRLYLIAEKTFHTKLREAAKALSQL